MQSCRQTSPNTQCNYCTVELKFWTIMPLSLLLQSFYINKVYSSLFTNTQSSFRKLAGVIENQREFIHVLHSIYWHHWQSLQMTYGGQQRAFVGSSLTQMYHQKKRKLLSSAASVSHPCSLTGSGPLEAAEQRRNLPNYPRKISAQHFELRDSLNVKLDLRDKDILNWHSNTFKYATCRRNKPPEGRTF